jgi:hypothetical protein
MNAPTFPVFKPGDPRIIETIANGGGVGVDHSECKDCRDNCETCQEVAHSPALARQCYCGNYHCPGDCGPEDACR